MVSIFDKAVATGPLLFAAGEPAGQGLTSSEVTQWDYHSPAAWDGWDWLLTLAFGLATIYVVALYIRDTRALADRGRLGWRLWMTLLRLGVLACLFVVFLNPHERTETQAYRPSQVAILVDTSASMEQPAADPRTSASSQIPSRWEAVRTLLADSPLIAELQASHNVDLYTFDADVSDVQHRFATRFREESARPTPNALHAATTTPTAPPDWNAVLRPHGQTTRLGDSLDKLLAEIKGKSLSGVVVLTDGASNAGRDWRAAQDRAKEHGIRLVTVGVGSTTPPVNLELAKVIAPSDVQLGDPFEITALLQSSGLIAQLPGGTGRKTVTVELLEKTPDDEESQVVDQADATLDADGVPVSVAFERHPGAAGEFEYSVRVKAIGLVESRDDDNVKSRAVQVFDRPLRVLVIAGGPMRDYQFAKNSLYRHKSFEVDVWLQTGEPGISQDANELLYEFPQTREDLFRYDVVLAFDPDWSQIPEEGRALLESWVTDFGGGVILVAGDVYTPQLAAVNPEREPGFVPIFNLYPVVLDEIGLKLGQQPRSLKAYPLGLTQAGQAADFLQLTDDPATAPEVWEEFPGVYRCYPTRASKGGATIYAEFTDPLSRGRSGAPVLLAGQRYGLGSGMYLGSPEVWRLRSLDETYYDRFWVKLTRKAAEGRLKRGLERTVILLEGRDYEIGQAVPLRARLVDVNYQPLADAAQTIDVFDPSGKPLLPAPELLQDRNRPEEYAGMLRVTAPGRYRLELRGPQEQEPVRAEINVVMPRLEATDPLQNVSLLKNLAEGTGGAYVSLEDAAEQIPSLLPNAGHEFLLSQRIQEMWDQQWLLVLIGVLLAAEWLTRKWLRLA
ncbi:MAG: hypothetical protein ACK5Q5_04245 [Planctomycetaceae bacterium]